MSLADASVRASTVSLSRSSIRYALSKIENEIYERGPAEYMLHAKIARRFDFIEM